MRTNHQLITGAITDSSIVAAESAALVVTSPPYPMIAMWDAGFAAQCPVVAAALTAGDGPAAFEAMHRRLDGVWERCAHIITPGGFLCVNIGDATRSIGGGFRLYTNHARIIAACERLGFQSLPGVIWRKPSNAPNKFMGSGVLPAGAYLTLEHEYVLVFRRGGKREFDPDNRERRAAGAIFWEERNLWFSDQWDFRGVRQRLDGPAAARKRSAAFPFELPFRLISMFSLPGELVVDPFVGTGTTILAAMATGRRSLGFDLIDGFAAAVDRTLMETAAALNERQVRRFQDHQRFVEESRTDGGHKLSHFAESLQTPVMSNQEREMTLPVIESITRHGLGAWEVSHQAFQPLSAPPIAVPQPRLYGFEGSQTLLDFA